MCSAPLVSVSLMAPKRSFFFSFAYHVCLLQSLLKWLKSPGITANDCEMIDASMRILALLSLNEDLAWKLIDHYDVFSYLEVGSECWTH